METHNGKTGKPTTTDKTVTRPLADATAWMIAWNERQAEAEKAAAEAEAEAAAAEREQQQLRRAAKKRLNALLDGADAEQISAAADAIEGVAKDRHVQAMRLRSPDVDRYQRRRERLARLAGGHWAVTGFGPRPQTRRAMQERWALAHALHTLPEGAFPVLRQLLIESIEEEGGAPLDYWRSLRLAGAIVGDRSDDEVVAAVEAAMGRPVRRVTGTWQHDGKPSISFAELVLSLGLPPGFSNGPSLLDQMEEFL